MEQDFVDYLLSIDYVQVSIPAFLALIFIEIFFDRKKKTGFYSFNDAIANIGCGATQILTAIFSAAFLLKGYEYLYEHQRITALATTSVWLKASLAVLLFLGVDLGYYWAHRFSHRVNIAWSGHGVHHQSEEYNLSVALRQSAFQVFFTWFFYLPLAVLGFSTAWYVSVASFVTMYQFWIHTRFIKTLGPLELILNTPSHHRVHHAINGPFIDKNYAGTLIIWDKMFGTFVLEDRVCVYGTVKPLQSFNPVWAQFAIFTNVLTIFREQKSVSNKLKTLIAPPGWPTNSEIPEVPTQTKYAVPLTQRVQVYTFVQFAVLLVCGISQINGHARLSVTENIAVLAILLLGLLSLGFILDQKRLAWRFEAIRLVLSAIALILLFA